MNTTALQTAGNVITLTIEPKPPAKPQPVPAPFRQRFKVLEFTNRGGSQSWRVTGIKRDGSRVRENYQSADFARKRQAQLEVEYLARPDDPATAQPALRPTRLTDVQLRLCEAALAKLDCDDDLLPAISHWLNHGKKNAVQQTVRLDEAVSQFKEWIAKQPDNELSRRTKDNLRRRTDLFANSLPDLELSAIDADAIAKFMDGRAVSKRTKINDRLVLSRFFAWCKESPRKWIATNPARKEERSKRTPRPSPAILSVAEVTKLLRAAEKFKRGRLVPYISACVFGGLRPTEAARLDWKRNINLDDMEIRLEAEQSKTRRPRTIKVSKTLAAWLRAYQGKPFFPSNWHKDIAAVKLAAGFGTPTDDNGLKRWTEDVMRHTAISHYFRQCGSYGLTAEWAGNSEQIIKDHYQGRVNSEDTKRFYALLPKKGGRK